MTERKPHSDNRLIDELTEGGAPSQSSSAGGDVARDVGSRAELHRATDPEDRERALGSDNPEDDEGKGDEATRQIKQGNPG